MLSKDILNEIETLTKNRLNLGNVMCQTQKRFFKLITIRDLKLVVTFATEVCF